MQKRGQATVFIIIGIVILVAVFLVLFLRGGFIAEQISPEEAREVLASQVAPLEVHVEECISKVAPDGIKTLALQGGTFKPRNFRQYNGTNVEYLCYKEPGVTTCIQKPLTRANVEAEISDYVKTQIFTCLNLNQFEQGNRFRLDTKEINVNTRIDDNRIQVNVDYPITLSRSGVETTVEEFSSNLRLPLGKLIDLTSEIINSEISTGEFDNIDYMIRNRGEIIVERHTPFPDEIYVLQTRDGSLTFQFGIEGESKI